MARSAEIVVRVTEIPEVREILTDAQDLIVLFNEFDNAVAEFGLDHPEYLADTYQRVHDRLAALRQKYPKLTVPEGD